MMINRLESVSPHPEDYGPRMDGLLRKGIVPHFLYLITEFGLPDDPCKIGKTKNPVSRLASLQTGNHRRLGYCALWLSFSSDVVTRMETEVLRNFEIEHGEWLRADSYDVVAFIKTHASERGWV